MAKSIHDDVLDTPLQYIEDNADWCGICEDGVTTYEHAHSNKGVGTGKCLANHVPTFTGPVAGDVSGRKTTVDQEAADTVDVTGTAADIALCDIGVTKLLLVTTCTPQLLTAANQVTMPAWDIEFTDPT